MTSNYRNVSNVMLVEGVAGGAAAVLAYRAWALSLAAARSSAARAVRRAFLAPNVAHYCPNRRLESALISPLVTRRCGVVFNVLTPGVGGSTAMRGGLAEASQPGAVQTSASRSTPMSKQFSGALIVDCAAITERASIFGLTCTEAFRHEILTQLRIPVDSRALNAPLSDYVFHPRERLRFVLVLDHFEMMYDAFPPWDVKNLVRYVLAADARRSGSYIVAINTSDRRQAAYHVDPRFHVTNNDELLHLDFSDSSLRSFRWSEQELGEYLAARCKSRPVADAEAAAWVKEANGLIGSLVNRCDAAVCMDDESSHEDSHVDF